MGSKQSGAQELAGELEPEYMELAISSDGTPHGTSVTDTKTGRSLSRVSEIRLHVKAGEIGTAEITLTKPKMNLTGRFKVVDDLDC